MSTTTPSYQNTIHWQGISYKPSAFRDYIQLQLQSKPIADWEKDIFSFISEWMDESKKLFTVKTSGSTGRAKSIGISRSAMIRSAVATGDYLQLTKNNTALLCLPAKYIAGKMMLVRAFTLGLDLYYTEPKIDILNGIQQNYDFCAMIPMQLQYAIDCQLLDQINKIKTIIIGGAALEKKYISALQKLDTQFYATYGMTETITHIALQKLNGHNKSNRFRCLNHIHIDTDNRGCLRINNNNTGKQIITNDLAKAYSSSEFIILGRIDHIINSGGLKINPVEIESKIAFLIKDSFMIGYKTDDTLGQKLVLIIQTDKDNTHYHHLLSEIRKTLPSNQCPKEVISIPKLFTTENQKLDRKKNIDFIKTL